MVFDRIILVFSSVSQASDVATWRSMTPERISFCGQLVGKRLLFERVLIVSEFDLELNYDATPF